MEADIGTFCVSAEGAQGGTGQAPPPPHSPPPLFLHSYIGWLQNSIVKFSETRNFDEIILNFVKFREIQGKFLWNTKLNIL